MDTIRKGVHAVYKIMPDQVQDVPLEDVIEVADEVIYLVARDFQRQARSWIAMQSALDWGNNGFKLSPNFKLRDLHLSTNPGKTIEHHVTFTQDEADPYIDQLIRNWDKMAELYEWHPREVIYMEDFLANYDYLPYNREYTWEHEIIIPEFHPDKLFK